MTIPSDADNPPDPRGRPDDSDPSGRPDEREPDGRPDDSDPTGRPIDSDPTGRPDDSDPTGGPIDSDPSGRPAPGHEHTGTVRVQQEPWLTPQRLANLVLVLIAAYAALMIIRALRGVLIMLAVSLFLSFAMEPGVQWLSRRGMRRGIATALVFLICILLLIGFFALMLPLFISQLTDLARNVPSILDQLDAGLLSRLPFGIDLSATPDLQRELIAFANRLGSQLREVLPGAAGRVVAVGATAIGVLFQLATIALVTFYLVADGPRARRTLATPLAPARQREMLAIWEIAVEKTGGYIYSRLLLAVAATIAHGAFFLAIGLPSPIPLAVWIGVTSAFIPVIGTYLGAFAALLVAFVANPIDALFVAIFAVAYQQLENYVLAPRIQSTTMDVHPALAFLSVVIGGSLLGAVGALLALPATAVVQALLSTYVRRHELIAEFSDVTLPHDLEHSRGAGRPVGPPVRGTVHDDEEVVA